jgi:threonine dehydrogenase-like Zn-dependent dehydrogenase
VKAIIAEPKKAASVLLEEVAEPDEREGSVLVEGIAVGVCGTDVEIVEGNYGWAPPGGTRLVLGHESLGRVLDPGPKGGLKKADIGFEPDIIVECTGVGSVISESIRVIGAGGVICLTGVGHGAARPS